MTGNPFEEERVRAQAWLWAKHDQEHTSLHTLLFLLTLLTLVNSITIILLWVK